MFTPPRHRCIILLLLATVCIADIPTYRIQTARDLNQYWERLPELNLTSTCTGKRNPNATITINSYVSYQTFLGFGGAFTDSAAWLFSQLNSSTQEKLLSLYWSDDGLKYRMGRLTIGSCDFSLKSYTYDDVVGDVNLDHFSIEHDEAYIIPFIKRAQQTAKEPLMLIASPWSAPGWMKTNGNLYCLPLPWTCLDCSLKEEYYDTWALYLAKYVTEYRNSNVSVWGITVQNEPGACQPTYECMHWNAETERDFIRDHLGPVLKSQYPDIKLLIYDHNKDHVATWANTIFSDAEASKYADGTAFHWYSGDDFENVLQTYQSWPNKLLIATEATESREKDAYGPPTWEKGEHYAHDIIGDLNAYTQGWIDWNLLLDMEGGPDHAGPDKCEGIIKCGSDAMLRVNLETQEIHPQIFYWYVGHLSRFLPTGSVRIGIEYKVSTPHVLQSNMRPEKSKPPADGVIETVAFLTPSKDVVVVLLNRNDSPATVELADAASSSCGIVVLPEHSIQTVVYGGS